MSISPKNNLPFDARKFLLRKLSRQALHRAQAKKLLKEKGVLDEEIDRLIASLDSLFDDEAWVDGKLNRFTREGKSALQVKLKLRQAGVVSPSYDEKEALEVCIRKKYSCLLSSDCPREKKQRAIQALLRRGYSLSLIHSILRENVLSSLIAEEER